MHSLFISLTQSHKSFFSHTQLDNEHLSLHKARIHTLIYHGWPLFLFLDAGCTTIFSPPSTHSSRQPAEWVYIYIYITTTPGYIRQIGLLAFGPTSQPRELCSFLFSCPQNELRIEEITQSFEL